MLRITSIILACLFFMSPAEARHRHHVVSYEAHAGCNIIFPCEGVATSARGVRVQKAMGGFGTPRKTYTPQHATRAAHHIRVAHRGRRHRMQEASHHKSHLASGIVKATDGAVAYVAVSAQSAFQCVIDKLEATGYQIKFMGGFARGGHIRGSLHYSGHALDINQVSRNVTIPRMPNNEISIANGCGLISGAQWAHGDSGHFQLGGYAGTSHKHYANRHHHRRYASR